MIALGELSKVVTGSTPKTSDVGYFGGEIPFVTPGEVGYAEPITKAARCLTPAGAERARMVPAGTVLVTCIGASLGNVGISGTSISVNQQINALVFDTKRIYPRYGFYACRMLRAKLRSMAPATTMPIVNKSKFSSVEIPVPSLVEQRRIAAILDQVGALCAKRRESIALLDDLAQSIFLDTFGDRLRRSDDVKSVPLSSVADISSGITKGRRVPAGPLEEVPYLAVVNVQDRRLDLSTVKVINVSAAEIGRFKLKSNDLLLTEGGDPDKLGRGTLWSGEIPLCLHQNHVFRVRIIDRNCIEPVYLNWIVASSYGKRYFLRVAKQTTGIASINKTQLGLFPLVVPDLTEQQLFRDRIDQIEAQKGAHQMHLAALDELFGSLQQRAFAGKLWDHEDSAA